jgi:serine/threonine protein kinase/TolA-binding protein
MALDAGQMLGHYRILGHLGTGGMGVVYKAQDTRLGRLVALKVLSSEAAGEAGAAERFRREARTASSLTHPNICTIYTFDEQDGQLFLVMELLDGEPLDRRLSGRPLDLRLLLEIGAQVADALEAAHLEGVLHRDIKPANIFLTRRGSVKVLDFGLAKLARRGQRTPDAADPSLISDFTSTAGTTVGTVAYMSPEQARGEELDPRTDLFSLGVVLYEMATGSQTFPGATTAVVFDGILNRDPLPPRTLNAAIPDELERIIGKALEKDRALRYQTAADLRADLRRLARDPSAGRIASHVTITAPPPAPTVIIPAVDLPHVDRRPGAAAQKGASRHAPGVSDSDGVVISASSDARARGGTDGAVTSPLTHTASPPASAREPLSARRLPAAIERLIPQDTSVRLSTSVVAALMAAVAVAAIGGSIWAARTGPALPASDRAPRRYADVTLVPAVASQRQTDTLPTDAAVSSAGVLAAGAPPPARLPATDTAGSPDPAARRHAAAGAAEHSPRGEVARTGAARRLEIARAKIANKLPEPALADLRQVISAYPATPAAAEASLLAAELLEQLGRPEEAMAAHVEFTQRFARDRRVPASMLRLAQLMAQTRDAEREETARALLGQIAAKYPRTSEALSALQLKVALEQDRRGRVHDPVLGVEVPPVLPTLRMLVEQFPRSPLAMVALHRLAGLYENLGQHERAAQAYEMLASRFPRNPHDAWYRAGEIYERRLKDVARAREAYARVPEGSARYRDAQRKLSRR